MGVVIKEKDEDWILQSSVTIRSDLHPLHQTGGRPVGQVFNQAQGVWW